LMNARKPLRVLLDTNFLMLPTRIGVDIRRELERVIDASFSLATTPAVLDELRRLKVNVKTRELKNIEFALTMAEGIEKLRDSLGPEEDVDDQLVRLSDQEGLVVATTDAELRRRIRRLGHPVVFLRQRRYLAIDGLI
jgi:rRNA-processing protein FCF1